MVAQKIRDLITWLVYDKEWYWLELFISTLCELEVKIKLLISGKRAEYNASKTRFIDMPYFPYEKVIPKDTIYCQDCEYLTHSKIATWLLSSQCNGYCYYLGRGDFSFVNPTDLLWDGCKECGMSEFSEDEDE